MKPKDAHLKRVIVDFKKLTPEILALLVERYPDGYDDDHIISFRNAKNEMVLGRVCPTCAARAVARKFSFKVMNVFGSTREPPESIKIDSGIRSGSSTFPHIEYLQYSQFLGTWVCLKSSTICKITYGVSEPSILRKTTPDNL